MERGRGETGDDRAVSEVISVVLMVAVTIVLAAMVGTVLLNIVGGVEKDPIAGATIKADSQTNNISVTYAAKHQPGTRISVKILNSSGSAVGETPDTLSDVGDSESYSMPNDGTYRVIITATAEGKSAIINDVEKTV